MPETGKDFPLLNGLSMASGPSAPAASGNQIAPLERNNPIAGMMHSQHQQQMQQGMGLPQQLQLHNQQMDKDKDGDGDGNKEDVSIMEVNS